MSAARCRLESVSIDTQVRYLKYADAEKIAPKLKEQITGIAQASQTGGAAGAAASPTAQAGGPFGNRSPRTVPTRSR